MKKYLVIFLAGLLMIGVGAGICVFEFAGYQTVESLPNTHTQTLYTKLRPGQPVSLNYYGNSVKWAVDDSLKDQARLEVSSDADFNQWRVYFSDDETNVLRLYTETDPFAAFPTILELLKKRQIYTGHSTPEITIYVNSSYYALSDDQHRD